MKIRSKCLLVLLSLFALASCKVTDISSPTDTSSPIIQDSSTPGSSTQDSSTPSDFSIPSDSSSEDQTPTILGIEVTALPSKVEYTVGEVFDNSGMVVQTKYSDGTHNEITDYTYSTAPLTLQDSSFEISYLEYTTSIELTITPAVVTLTDVELRLIENATYKPTDDFYSLVEVRELYSDNSSSSWYPITKEDLLSVSLNNGVATAQIEILINNKTFAKEISINYEGEVVGVSDLLSKQPSEDVYYLNGIVISLATSMAATELLVMDKQSKEIVGITNLLGPGLIYNYTLETHGIEVGDEVLIPVTLKQYEEKEKYSNSNKLHASYAGGDDIECCILSRNNDITFDVSNATVIASQEDLANFLSASNRFENFYEFVKIDCATNLVSYSSSRHYRFFFDDAIATLADQQIDGVSPCFNDGSQYYTTNKTFSEMIFGVEDYSSTFAEPAKVGKEIYALFIGGNGYYHEFVVLDESHIKDLNIVLESTTFKEPNTLVYPLNAEFSLTGSKITYDYTYNYLEEVEITMDMLDATTLPDMDVPGTYEVKGSYKEYNFSFTVVVEDKKVTSIEIQTMPTTTSYNHRLTYDDLDVTGGQLKVNYDNGTHEIIDITKEMVSDTEEFKIGQVSYPITYKEATTNLVVTVVQDTISVSELKTHTSGTYEVEALVVGPASSHAAAELLIKDVTTNDVIGLYNTGVVGSYNALDLDESVVNVGDKIIVTVTIKTTSNELHTNGKVYGNANTFKTSVMILSSNNEITWNLEQLNATNISTRSELEAFLADEDRFYSFVKISNVKAVTANSGYRIFFGSESSNTEQYIDGVSPFIYHQTANQYFESFTSYFTTPTSTSYSAPATCESGFYALFVGGNKYYYDFVVVSESWILEKTETE